MFYQDKRGCRPVDEWLWGLGPKVRAKVWRTIHLLEAKGVNLGFPFSSHVRGKIFELRTSFARLEPRVLYFAVAGRTFVLLHGFLKTTDETPEREIVIAEKRAADYEARS